MTERQRFDVIAVSLDLTPAHAAIAVIVEVQRPVDFCDRQVPREADVSVTGEQYGWAPK